MAKRSDITARDLRDAAVRAAANLGRLTELQATKQGEAELWTLKAELDPERIRRRDEEAPVTDPVAPSVPAQTPPA